jgi:hypothetical protein
LDGVVMKTKSLVIVGVALAVFWFVSPASAAVVTLTYRGIVGSPGDSSTDELDISGLFGPTGSSLAGDAYTAVYVYDTNQGTNVNPPDPYYLDVYGGALYGTPTPAISETMTINGITVSLADTYWGEIILCSVCIGANSGLEEVAGANSEMTNILYALGSPIQFPPSLDAPLDFSVVSNTTGSQASRGQFVPDDLYLMPLTVNVSTTPIPAALPLFATGVGAMCLFGWRRKRKTPAALTA